MELSDTITNRKKKVNKLEMELNDLRQGLTTLQDFYNDLRYVSGKQEGAGTSERESVQPQNDEDGESEGILRFHRERLIADPSAHIPRTELYDAFVRFITKTSRHCMEQDAFEFVFAQIKDPSPLFTRGEWNGYRFKNI